MNIPGYFVEFIDLVRHVFSTDERIPLHAPCFRGKEKEYVIETIESTYVSSVGEYVDLFEKCISDYTGAAFAVATVSGTAALHIALILSGVRSGDEVITTPLTFVATCNAIRYCGADPVFVDVERESLGMCPQSLEKYLVNNAEVRDDGLCWNRNSGKIIRVCLPIHNLGHPAKVREIFGICNRNKIEVVEDAAESLGSFSNGIHSGRIGSTAILSFNGNKVITTGGGGALITDDENLAIKAKHLTTTAKQAHPWFFLHDQVGYNYRLPNINAALGCAQIEQISNFVMSKRELASLYHEWFIDRGIEFVLEPQDAISNYWLNAIILENRSERDNFLEFTNNQEVMTRAMWTPMHTLPMFNKCQRTSLDVAESIEARLVNIPSSVI